MTTTPEPAPAPTASTQPQKQAPRVRAVHARNLDTISGAEELVASVACAIDGSSLFLLNSEFRWEGGMLTRTRSSA